VLLDIAPENVSIAWRLEPGKMSFVNMEEQGVQAKLFNGCEKRIKKKIAH